MTILHLILLLTHPSESYQIDLRESQKSMTPILESTSKPHLFLIGKANNRADEFQVVSDYYNTSIQADYATIKFDEGRPYSLRLNYSGASSDLLEASSRRIAEDLSLDSSK